MIKYSFMIVFLFFIDNLQAQTEKWLPYNGGYKNKDVLYDLNLVTYIPNYLERNKDTIYSVVEDWNSWIMSAQDSLNRNLSEFPPLIKEKIIDSHINLGDSIIYVYNIAKVSSSGFFYKKIANDSLSIKILNSNLLANEVNKQLDSLGLDTYYRPISRLQYGSRNKIVLYTHSFIEGKDYYSEVYYGICDIKNDNLEITLQLLEGYNISGNTPENIVADFLNKNILKYKIVLSKEFFLRSAESSEK
ncbi:hypothetical protein Fleli_0183 [Bernardetia litoralis DSM 6794]|uniref:Uncharacterized protein n=1 Tax=Bernardetia litoralis (strain ATCC 23117 / DSM 6794 / NBRC 15988 / NCIMB 1366 / Fx l1 / Sio-4) TaxID=880071 RepID=I4AFE6_BERLS|nr:hypothetical protein [Bernardetia litoralis]AFM02681.1 hypothetical protein Fleli_0183 [Bernardetia litoralis DSM 6794]